MSQFPPPQQDYSPESFGAPPGGYPPPNQFGQPPMYQQPPPRRGGSGRVVMLICGGLLALMLLCCCCCLGLVVVSAQSPAGVVGMWGIGGIAESWDFSNTFVCEGSQAATYTDALKAEGARFTAFNANDNVATDGVEATGTIVRGNGTTETWSATFFTADGGTLGTCIDRIDEN